MKLRRIAIAMLVSLSPAAAFAQQPQQQPPPQPYPQQPYPYPQQPYPQQPYPQQQQPYPQQPYPQQQQPYPQQPYPQQQPQYYPPQQQQPQYYPQQQPQYYPPPPQQQQPPPRPAPAPPPPPPEPDVPTHAPKFSLYAGVRLSYIGFGFGFYTQRVRNGDAPTETTGNFAGNGFGPEFDIGARLAKRYIPYLFWEHGFMGQGHRFQGSDASSSTDFYGLGFRHVGGDVDSVGFVADLAIGMRKVNVSNGTESYSMSGLEFFRLGLGAEIRLMTLFSISPLVTIATGSLNDTQGTIRFSPEGSLDGNTEPDWKNGDVIGNNATYVVLSAGVGIHFDIFGE